jgi:hypothetical protein
MIDTIHTLLRHLWSKLAERTRFGPRWIWDLVHVGLGWLVYTFLVAQPGSLSLLGLVSVSFPEYSPLGALAAMMLGVAMLEVVQMGAKIAQQFWQDAVTLDPDFWDSVSDWFSWQVPVWGLFLMNLTNSVWGLLLGFLLAGAGYVYGLSRQE